MPPDSSRHAAEFRRSLSAATERVESLLNAAEQTASEIRAEAEADATRHQERRRAEVETGLSSRASAFEALTRPVVERLEALQAESGRLSSELDSALVGLRELNSPSGGESDAEDISTPEVPDAYSRPLGPATIAYEGTGTGASSEVEGAAGGQSADMATSSEHATSTEEPLLRATQLAVSGSSRAEIESALRSEFNLDDVEAVLDGILGPEEG